MKWILRFVLVIFVLLGVLVTYAFMTALQPQRPIGFQVTQTKDAAGRAFPVAVWYPTQTKPSASLVGSMLIYMARDGAIDGSNLPLVVLSHGNGGGPLGHVDLAIALASAGYIVAAPMHIGDNIEDQSAIGSVSFFSDRTQQLRATLDHLLTKWTGHDRINPQRIGAFGFSAGGFTVLNAVGAQPDLSIIAKHCASKPEFVCDVLRQAKSPLLDSATAIPKNAFSPDTRIKAAVVAAPGLGFTLVPNGLSAIQVPIQLWSGDKDDKVPFATNMQLVRDALGSKQESHVVEGAGHLSFLAPCGLLAPPTFCADAEQFDRKDFHVKMNADVIAFFEKNMK